MGNANKIPHNKFGITANPIGWQVWMAWQGRVLLGDIVAAARSEITGAIYLTVRHFNGEPWPINPTSYSVNVLERRVA